MEDHILVRYGELALKKSNLHTFINKVNNHIKRALKEYPQLTFDARGLRFYILLNGTNPDPVVEILKKIPGLYSFSLVTKTKEDLQDVKEAASILVKKELENGNKTFKVETSRSDKNFPKTSPEISREVAGFLFKTIPGLSADMYHPSFTLFIDIREEGGFLYTNVIKGLGGLPASILGKGMLLISGGIDSPVAGYLAIKKGIAVEAIHFASYPYTSEQSVQKVVDLLEKIAEYTEFQSINLYIVPFTNIQKAIYEHVREDYCITIMRRMMYRLSERLAKEKGSLCLLNGENIGQVASQTLESIQTIESVCHTPVVRPLACFDKQEIIDIAQKIDTYDISIRPYDDCCTVFVPKHPQIRPLQKVCEEEETKFDFEPMLKEALENTHRVVLKTNRHYDYLTKKSDSFDDLV
jgi:thiamine biosynthesis protein ThiI